MLTWNIAQSLLPFVVQWLCWESQTES